MGESGNNLGYSYYMPKGGLLSFKTFCPGNWCDIFGVFNRYLAPAYHHDRCERSVQMKLYTMHKREFVAIILGFFVALGLVILIGLVGPPITWSREILASSLKNVTEKEMAVGPFALSSPGLTAYHQQLWLISQVDTKSQDGEAFEKPFTMTLDLYGSTKDGIVKIFDGLTQKDRKLTCPGHGLCDPITLLHLGFIDFSKYFIVIKLYGLESTHQRYHIKDIHFYFKTYNPSFTQLEISFRFIYSLASFFITCWLMFVLRKYVTADWSIEQRWMSILLPLLFLYNNPIFPLSFLMNSTLPGMIDAIFQVTFLSGLLLFWLSIYHGLRQVERRFVTFYLPKVILVSSLWVSAIILSYWQKMNMTRDPTYNFEMDTVKFNNLKNFFILCGVTYLLTLFYMVFKAYSELRNMPYFDLRLKFLTGLMLVVMKITIGVTYLKFGMDIIEDHFVAELSTKYSSSAEFMAFYGLLNFYIFTMVYVYSPSTSATLQTASSQITKDNPSFSMVNDSDEDVIYGSDEDESKMPLNHHHSSRSQQSTKSKNLLLHHDESD